MRSRPSFALALSLSALTSLSALSGCGALGGAMSMAPSAGVTTGGAQDIGLARNQIAAGQIPPPEAFVVEGLLSEHDIDLRAPRCERRFCMNTGLDVAPALDTGEDALFMVVGFSSNIDLGAFRREPLNLAVVVDHSGSMGTGKMAAARRAIHHLIDQLDERDRLSLIQFDDEVDLLLESAPMDRERRAAAHELTDGLRADGSTDIESALAEGFAEVDYYRGPGRADRVILLTDARPNTGRSDDESFIDLTERYAQRGIGLTVFGVGLDFGQELSLAISQLPGANYIYLEDQRKLARVFDEDFDLLVTPVAWDFEMEIVPLPGFEITAAYGVPSWVASDRGGAVTLHIPTLFLSRNRGAIVLRLEPTGGAELNPGPVARAALSYRLARRSRADDWAGVLALPEEGLSVEGDPGVLEAVALVNAGIALRGASELSRAGRGAEAIALLDEALGLTDGSELQDEHRLLVGLRALIAASAPAPGLGEPHLGPPASLSTRAVGMEGPWIR